MSTNLERHLIEVAWSRMSHDAGGPSPSLLASSRTVAASRDYLSGLSGHKVIWNGVYLLRIYLVVIARVYLRSDRHNTSETSGVNENLQGVPENLRGVTESLQSVT